jgi:hypothetical protein
VPAHPLVQLSRVKFLEFVREPEAIFWVLVFPVLLSLALGIAFRAKAPAPLAIAVCDGPDAAEALRALAADPGLRPKVLASDDAKESLRTGRVALVVIPGDTITYWLDPARDESLVARLAADAALQRAAGRTDRDIWIINAWASDPSAAVAVTSGIADEFHPRFSSDGLKIFFVSNRIDGYGTNGFYDTERRGMNIWSVSKFDLP